MLAVELLLFEWTPRSFIPVAVAAIVAAVERTCSHLPTPLFPFSGGMDMSLARAGLLGADRPAVGAAVGVLTQTRLCLRGRRF